MTTPVSMQYNRDAMQSLIYFLNNQIYARSGASSYTTDTLPNFFNNLDIKIGYPDNLDDLDLPTIALVNNGSSPVESTFGDHVKNFIMGFSIHGFVGREQSHGDNMLLKDKLIEDIRSLLEDIDYVSLYQYPDFNNSVGDMGIINVVASNIPPTDEMEAGRYQFIVDFDVEYLKEI